MPRGGTLDVTAASFQAGPDMVELGLSPGTYLRLDFKDSGCGITPEHLHRIFDPYFSTKPMGAQKGQGLGLAVCRSILRAHGGQVIAESVVGQGSTFSVFLPMLQTHKAGS
jgi:signal transduction histidine kinase